MEGLSTIAERITRAGLICRAHKPAIIRSNTRKLVLVPWPIQNQKLMFDEHALGNHGSNATRSCKPNQGDDHVNEKDERVAHAACDQNPETAEIRATQ